MKIADFDQNIHVPLFIVPGIGVILIALSEDNFEFSKSAHQIEGFDPKSIRSGEIVGKVYNSKNEYIP